MAFCIRQLNFKHETLNICIIDAYNYRQIGIRRA